MWMLHKLSLLTYKWASDGEESGEIVVAKPIWCKCSNHSWTKRQLYSAWERDQSIMCPDPDCQREIPLETIEELLINLRMISPADEGHESTDSDATGSG